MKPLLRAFKTASVPFLSTFLLIGFLASQTPAQLKSSKINFTEIKHDFGKVQQGVELTYQYKFSPGDKECARKLRLHMSNNRREEKVWL